MIYNVGDWVKILPHKQLFQIKDKKKTETGEESYEVISYEDNKTHIYLESDFDTNYRAGDSVKVRDWNDLVREYNPPLYADVYFEEDGQKFTSMMKNTFCGKIYEVESESMYDSPITGPQKLYKLKLEKDCPNFMFVKNWLKWAPEVEEQTPKDIKNIFKALRKALGVKAGQEFRIKGNNRIFRISSKGVETPSLKDENQWILDNTWIPDLLEAEIDAAQVWPQNGSNIFFPALNHGRPDCTMTNYFVDNPIEGFEEMKKLGLVFPDKDSATKRSAEILAMLATKAKIDLVAAALLNSQERQNTVKISKSENSDFIINPDLVKHPINKEIYRILQPTRIPDLVAEGTV